MIETFFFMWCIFYIYKYGPPNTFIHNLVIKLYFILDETLDNFNQIIYSEYWDMNYDFSDLIPDKSDEKNDSKIDNNKPIVKYEDKYIEDIRRLNKDWILSEEEVDQKENHIEDFLINTLETIRDDKTELQQMINHFKKEMEEDIDIVNYIENENEDGDDLIEETTLEERNEYRTNQIQELTEKLAILKIKSDTEEGLKELRDDAEKQAMDYIVNKRIEKLNNSYIMEKTPQGNVLMIYDKERESFRYYSDSTIPYRYLEVVGRKYVKLFNCRPLFVDMEEELKLVEEKWTKDYEVKKAKEAEEKTKVVKPTEVKKNVFAKFKNYNKDAGGKISMAAPPKNSIPNKPINADTKENEKILLKKRANRYTYEGKLANFNFLQKIEKKVFNKKLGLTFADFKRMNNK